MIVLALGANLPGPAGPPAVTLAAALEVLAAEGVGIERVSRLYQSRPVPPSGQPDFRNAAAALRTERSPDALMDLLLGVEARLGRTRSQRWEARVIDLDLIDYHSFVTFSRDDRQGLVLPHPRAHDRAFVLDPLADLDPAWRHPILGATAMALRAGLGAEQVCAPAPDRWTPRFGG